MGAQWTGNIRELENKIQKAILMTRTSTLLAEDLDIEILPEHEAMGEFLPFKQAKERFERTYMEWALKEADGNARLAGNCTG